MQWTSRLRFFPITPWRTGASSLGPSRSLANCAWVALLLLFIGAYVCVVRIASFGFPVPWGDESTFLWQAISFQKTNSLSAPQLLPDRPLCWMPPGYMIVTGTLFKIFGFSLGFARMLSLVFMVAAFVLLAFLIRRYGSSIPALLLCGLFLLNARFIAAGNVARMETLLLLVVVAGFLLLQNHEDYKGLALLAISPLIHPNGGYFCVAAVAYFFLSGRFHARGRILTVADKLFLVAPLVFWSAYAIYAILHWEAFRHDMAFQFGDPRNHRDLRALVNGKNLLFLTLALLCFAYGLRKHVPATFLLVIAVPAWLIDKVRCELWYQPFEDLSFLLLSIVVFHVARHFLENLRVSWKKLVRSTAVAAVALTLLFANHRMGMIEGPLHYLTDMELAEMRIAGNVPYVTDSDVAEIRTFLNSLRSPDRLVSVEMYPWADGLYFEDLDGKAVRFSVPVFHPAFYPAVGDPVPGAMRSPDVFIIHTSRSRPRWLSAQARNAFVRAAINPSDKGAILRQRDGTEIWYFKKRRL